MSLLRYTFFIFICTFTLSFAQNDSIGFSYTILYPETVENSDVTVSADTVKFRLFYVDDVCSDFYYKFMIRANKLLVQRSSPDADQCTSDEQILYGVEGILTGVPKGKHIFELQTGPDDTHQESIFRELVNIKR
ncbi:MAG: hypothetical protein GX267_16090 [Fibrobacter sp.]|jgi:hypothetical protein|nr:hypothetical protein [Fibrobacter sp.]